MILFFLVACSDKTQTTTNASPDIQIQSHSNNTNVETGPTVFRAVASDSNNDAEELEIRWFIGDELVCDWETPSGSGESTCTINVPVGTHIVFAEVRDLLQIGERGGWFGLEHPADPGEPFPSFFNTSC